MLLAIKNIDSDDTILLSRERVVISYATLKRKPLLTSPSKHCRAKLVPRRCRALQREATLCQSILNALQKFAQISKFLCFHETKQTQKEVGRFFYNMDEFVFENFNDSRRILASFAKFFR